MREIILAIDDLSVRYPGIEPVQALSQVSFTISSGEIVGVVGESGSGKSTLAMAVMGLLPSGTIREGKIIFKHQDLCGLSEKQLTAVRGKDIAFIFQEPAASFNPVLSIGYQFAEVLESKYGLASRGHQRKIISESLAKVRLPDAGRIMAAYPHQLSGGQLQRVSLAMAIALRPALLIADEPTSSLDVTIASSIINLLKDLRREYDLPIMFITHNLELVRLLCDRVVVIYQGQLRESGPVDSVLGSPRDEYTKSLLAAFHALGDE